MSDKNYKYGISPPTLFQDDSYALAWNIEINHLSTLDYFIQLLENNNYPESIEDQKRLANEAGIWWDLSEIEIKYIEDKINIGF